MIAHIIAIFIVILDFLVRDFCLIDRFCFINMVLLDQLMFRLAILTISGIFQKWRQIIVFNNENIFTIYFQLLILKFMWSLNNSNLLIQISCHYVSLSFITIPNEYYNYLPLTFYWFFWLFQINNLSVFVFSNILMYVFWYRKILYLPLWFIMC